MLNIIAVIAYGWLVVLTSCDRVFVAEPSIRDLVGVYRLSPKSKEFLREKKGYDLIPSSSIELRLDSSISIQNLPDCTNDGFGRGKGMFLSGEGKWQVEKAFIGYGLNLEIENGGSMGPGIYAGPFIVVRRRTPPHSLEITVGDPDSGETILYERQSS